MGEESETEIIITSLGFFFDSYMFNALPSSVCFLLTCLFNYNQLIYPLPLAITTLFSSPGW